MAYEDESPFDPEPQPETDWSAGPVEDEWWKKGCPHCQHELDVAFHGGVSCPQCGWEGDMIGDTMVGGHPVSDLEADSLWPDFIPWGEDEQEYYRTGKVSYGWRVGPSPKPVNKFARVARRARRHGFFRVGADVSELARKQREALKEQAGSLKEFPFAYDAFVRILDGMPDGGYKVMPWVAREYKRLWKQERALQWEANQIKGDRQWSPDMTFNDLTDRGFTTDETTELDRIWRENDRVGTNLQNLDRLADQAAKWVEYAKTYNMPLPELNSKSFDGDQMHSWIQEMREKESVDPRRWTASEKVYEFPDGWYIANVGSADLEREGKIMQHCVGGMHYRDNVDEGDLAIFSLREPNGMPHVTMSMENPPSMDQLMHQPGQGRTLNLPEIYGKQDEAPIPEYQDRIDEWFAHLRQRGFYVEEMESEPPEPEHQNIDHPEGPFYVNNLQDLKELGAEVWSPSEHWFSRDEDGNYDDEDNTYYYTQPREVAHPHESVYDHGAFVDLANQFVEAVHNAHRDDREYDPRPSYTEQGWPMDDDDEDEYLPQDMAEAEDFIQNLWSMAQVVRDQTGGRDRWPELAPIIYETLMNGAYYQGQEPPVGGHWNQEQLFEGMDYEEDVLVPGGEILKAAAEYAMQLGQIANAQAWQQEVEVPVRPPHPEHGGFWNTPPEGMNYNEWVATWPTQMQNRHYYLDVNNGFKDFFNRPEAKFPAQKIPGALSKVAKYETLADRAFKGLSEQGGFTVKPNGHKPRPGYYVAEEGFERVIPFESLTPTALKTFFEVTVPQVNGHPNAFFGGWRTPKGDVFLDVSLTFDGLREAVQFARDSGQRAIWDGYLNREVRLDDPNLEY